MKRIAIHSTYKTAIVTLKITQLPSSFTDLRHRLQRLFEHKHVDTQTVKLAHKQQKVDPRKEQCKSSK
eukprot:m.173989 g.173989  ORF g.173989 m.173989 type:complete len:68 (-) comp16747_c0_seq1:2649-2852(-)